MTRNKTQLFSRILGSALGLGYFPLMPGSLASLFCAAAAFFLAGRIEIGFFTDLGIFLLLLLLGLISAAALSQREGKEDPSWFVMDEVAGMWLAMLGLPKDNIPVVITAWLLFRIFDIFKPWIIGRVDKMNTSAAMILDDLLAAVPAWLGAFILWKLL